MKNMLNAVEKVERYTEGFLIMIFLRLKMPF